MAVGCHHGEPAGVDPWVDVLRAFAVPVRRADDGPGSTAELDKLTAQYIKALEDPWAAGWKKARRPLDALPDAVTDPDDPDPNEVDELVDQAMRKGGALLGQWVPESTQEQLVTLVARAYAGAHAGALIEVAELGGPTVEAKRSMQLVSRAAIEFDEDFAEAIFEQELATSMTIHDKRASAWLANDTLFWVGDAWDAGLGSQIANQARRSIIAGGGRKELSARLAKDLAHFGRPAAYWDVVSSASLVRSRSMGQMSAFFVTTVADFEFVAMMDRRTSPVCRDMNGRVFTIKHAEEYWDRVTDVDDPDDLKEAAPWVSPSDIAGKSEDELAAQGVVAPPLHGRCRSTLQVKSFSTDVSRALSRFPRVARLFQTKARRRDSQ